MNYNINNSINDDVQEANIVIREQLKSRKIYLEQQKSMERKNFEQMSKEYEEYLKEQKKLCDKKKQFKWQIRKDLNDQINDRRDIIVSVKFITNVMFSIQFIL